MGPVVILLPPSEGKAAGGTGRWSAGSGAFPQLSRPRRAVARALAEAMAGPVEDQRRLLGVGGPTLERAVAANRAVLGAPTLPAWQRYAGVVYEHLGAASLPEDALGSVVVLSGLLGAVTLVDATPDYKLKMGARLGSLGLVSRWWAPTLARALPTVVAGRPVLDLLPNEHAAAWRPEGDAVTRVRFERPEGGGRRRAVGHDAKAVKGVLARAVLRADGPLLDVLADFEWQAWRLDRQASTPHEAVVVEAG